MADELPQSPLLVLPIVQGEVRFISAETQTTVGAAGGATALPATPTLYMKMIIDNTEYVCPLYAVS